MPQETEKTKKNKQSKKTEKPEAIWCSGRRKTAVARIKLTKGKGEFSVNDQTPEEYFPTVLEQEKLFAPFQAVGRNKLGFDVSIKVNGGGKNGQLEACVHGLARALEKLDSALRPTLKKKGLLTRDPRMRERKKYGLKRARKAPQYSKR